MTVVSQKGKKMSQNQKKKKSQNQPKAQPKLRGPIWSHWDARTRDEPRGDAVADWGDWAKCTQNCSDFLQPHVNLQ